MSAGIVYPSRRWYHRLDWWIERKVTRPAWNWVMRQTICRVKGHDWRWRTIGYVSEHAEYPAPHVCNRCWVTGASDTFLPFP